MAKAKKTSEKEKKHGKNQQRAQTALRHSTSAPQLLTQADTIPPCGTQVCAQTTQAGKAARNMRMPISTHDAVLQARTTAPVYTRAAQNAANEEGHWEQDEQEYNSESTEKTRLEKELVEDMGTVMKTKGEHGIHCLTVAGQVEGHVSSPQGTKTTKYEHVIPQLVAVEEDPEIEGLLIILNTVGGDVEAGLALAELIASLSKPSATLVLGGGHSIGIPLAVSAKRSFIVPTATMTVHPVRHSGLVLGVPQTMRYFEQMQERITGFVAKHSHIGEKRFVTLMMNTGELVMDVGTVLDGKQAVKEGLIDELGGLSDALRYLYKEIEARKS